MSTRVVKKTEISTIKGRPKHAQVYGEWFKQALILKQDEALEITLNKSNPNLPSPRAAVFAVQRWNQSNPKQRIKCIMKNSRLDKPILYLFAQEKEEELTRKKLEKA